MLCMLCTSQAHGLVPAQAASTSSADAGSSAMVVDAMASASGQQQQQQVGRKVVRLLQRLEPSEVLHHAQLLQHIGRQQPQLAAELLHVLPYSLEPASSSKWLLHMALLAQLLQQVAAATPALCLLAAAGGEAPGMEAAVVRNMLKRCLPSGLSKASLSRGVQHASPAVQYATLCVMASMLEALAPVLQALESAAGKQVPAAGGSSSSSSWGSLLQQLKATIRCKVPDVQTLVALQASLDKGTAGAAAAAAGKGDAAGSADLNDADQQQQEDSVADDPQERREQQQLQLLHVLALYQRWLPEAAADARLDPAKLLPGDVLDMLDMSAAEQLLRLQVLQAASDAAAAAGSSRAASVVAAAAAAADAGGLAAAQLTPLALLACGE
jgi:hypothetical protein